MSKKTLTVIASYVFILLITVFTGCQNLTSFNLNGTFENPDSEITKNETPFLTFNFYGGNEKTVNPVFDCSKLTAITLKGTVTDGVEETLFTEKTYAEITASNFTVPLTKTGTYSFVMTAKLNERNYSCSLSNVEIKCGKNELSFSLAFTNQDENFVPGNGNIQINLKVKNHSDIKYAKVCLLKNDGTPAFDEEKIDNSNNGTFTYTKSNVPAGNYTVKYSFYNGENLLGYYMETVNVSKDLSSTAIREVEDVAQYYKITYELGGGSWVTDYEPASVYSKFGIASLPAWNKAFNENDGVEGWYYDESFTDKATNENIKTKTGDITLYPKYDLIASSDGFGDLINRIKASGVTETRQIKILDTNPDLTIIADALKDKNVKVGIDLSRCTELTTVPNACFGLCHSLTEITIPEGVTKLENLSIAQCHSLVKVTLPDTLESIGAASFKECENLKDITIPEKVTFIGADAFANCASLTSISIPKGVTEIPYSLFSDCSKLKTITIPDTITTIYDTAFYNCSSLEEIVIPDTVTSLIVNSLSPHSIFYGCSSLKKVTAPCRFKGDSFFENCFGERFDDIEFVYSHTYTNNEVHCDCGEDNKASNKGTCGTSANFLFYEETGIFSIEGSGDVTETDFSAFADKIKTVTIADTITSVYSNMFAAFTSLETVTAPCTIRKNAGINDNVTVDWHHEYENYDSDCSLCHEPQKIYTRNCSGTSKALCTYYVNTKVAVFTVGESGEKPEVTSLADPEDDECSIIMLQAEKVIIDSNITSIAGRAFSGYENLQEISMTEGLTEIGEYAFENLSKIKSIDIPDSVTQIDRFVFSGCKNLENVKIGKGVEYIDDWAFVGCPSTVKITAPNSLEGDDAFTLFYGTVNFYN